MAKHTTKQGNLPDLGELQEALEDATKELQGARMAHQDATQRLKEAIDRHSEAKQALTNATDDVVRANNT